MSVDTALTRTHTTTMTPCTMITDSYTNLLYSRHSSIFSKLIFLFTESTQMKSVPERTQLMQKSVWFGHFVTPYIRANRCINFSTILCVFHLPTDIVVHVLESNCNLRWKSHCALYTSTHTQGVRIVVRRECYMCRGTQCHAN